MKHHIISLCQLLLVLALAPVSTYAQGLRSAYFTDGYLYQHTLNPAMGNDQNYVAIPALGNINAEAHGNFGYEDIVRDNPLYPTESGKKKTSFMNPYLSDPLKGFNKSWNRVGADANITLLSGGFKAWGGYNTVEINAKSSSNVKLPYELFRFAVDAGNDTYNIGDLYVNSQNYVEIALGHSRDINRQWRVGAKVKLLLGIADADVKMKDVTANLTGDTWTLHGDAQAHMSMKGWKYKTEEKEYKAQAGSYSYINDVDVDGAGIGGVGLAADLGAVFRPDKYWEVSAALLDLGFIHWSNDCYATNRDKDFTFDGFRDTGIKNSQGNTADDQWDKYSDQIAQFYNLQDEGDKGGRTTMLSARMNIGVRYTLPSYEKIHFGLLSATRFCGKHTWTEGRLSANWEPLNWLDGGVNLAANTFSTSMGWIINVHPKGFNVFFGMDHLIGKVSKEMIPLSSNASLSMGMNVTF